MRAALLVFLLVGQASLSISAGEATTSPETSTTTSTTPIATTTSTETSTTTSATPIATVDLGTAANYVILTKSGISTVPTSSITGNMGVSPIAGTAMTGFAFDTSSPERWTSSQITGGAFSATHSSPVPTTLTTAVGDMETAYLNAEQRNSTKGVNIGAGAIGGLTLTTGVYDFNVAISIGVDVKFSGDADDVFILKTTKSLMQVAGTKVILEGGAQAKNIFWQVAGEVLVSSRAVMQGILLVKTKVVFETKSSLSGRVFSQTALTLDMATITQPV